MKLLVHIGLPKAASSTLQSEIFNNPSLGFELLNEAQDEEIPFRPFTDLITKNALAFDSNGIRKKFLKYIDEKADSELIKVFTQERLIGLPDRGQYYTKDVCDRLAEIVPEAKILIIIREQRKFVLSCYNQRMRGNSNIKIERFIGCDGYVSEGWPAVVDEDFLNYDLIVEYYQKAFGADNVLVCVFEELINDFESAINEIRCAFGMTEKVSYNDKVCRNKGEGMFTVACMRWVNTFCGEPHAYGLNKHGMNRFLNRAIRKGLQCAIPEGLHEAQKKRFMTVISEYYGDRFVRSNQRLGEMLGKDLKKWGYM